MPKFTRVCEEVERGSITFAEALERLAAIRDPLARQSLFLFQVADALLIGFHDGIAVCIDDAVQQLFDLTLDQTDFLFHGDALRPRTSDLRVPLVAEHFKGEIKQALRWLESQQNGLEFAFDLLFAHGLARLGATACIAEIIRVVRAPPFRPASGQRFGAMRTSHKSPERKVVVEVFAGRNLRTAVSSILYRLPDFQADQRFVMTAHELQSPIVERDVTGINGPRENLDNPLAVNLVVAVAGVCGLRLQKAFHFRQCLEATGSKTLHGFRDDRRERLIANQQLPVSRHALIAIAHRCFEHPISVHGAGAHPVLCLLSVLLPLMLGNRRKEVFAQYAVRVVAKLDGGAFQFSASLTEQIAKVPMPAHVTGEPVDVVDDDNAIVLAMRFEVFDDRDDPRTLFHAAGHGVLKHLHHIVAHVHGILAATPFLAAQAIAFAHLFCSRHAAIDECVFLSVRIHGLARLLPPPLASARNEGGRQGFFWVVMILGRYHRQESVFTRKLLFIPTLAAELSGIVAKSAIHLRAG